MSIFNPLKLLVNKPEHTCVGGLDWFGFGNPPKQATKTAIRLQTMTMREKQRGCPGRAKILKQATGWTMLRSIVVLWWGGVISG